MMEQIESLKKEAFVGLDERELRRQEDRLKRIREISADFLKALERTDPQAKVEPPAPEERRKTMCVTEEKPSVTLPGRVEKIIKS
jgi:hypothetical protein